MATHRNRSHTANVSTGRLDVIERDMTGVIERMSTVETRLDGLQHSISQMAGAVGDLTRSVNSYGKTDWKLLVAMLAFAVTVMVVGASFVTGNDAHIQEVSQLRDEVLRQKVEANASAMEAHRDIAERVAKLEARNAKPAP